MPSASLYHASKWGVEGFMGSIAQEVASFGIRVTIVEPGGARTNFRGAAGAKLGERLDAYEGTLAGMMHAMPGRPDPSEPGPAAVSRRHRRAPPRAVPPPRARGPEQAAGKPLTPFGPSTLPVWMSAREDEADLTTAAMAPGRCGRQRVLDAAPLS
ncbi:SDR family NAD(P)-dependent oxidoreductase [Methylorubrum extorquens]|jgi:NAD(P)-dependent dehydrogenase (short-subunit alcohol dehydrogenase family)|uniref:Short-chain dehydrogenase/reductase SDR n=1 Tax=Methylorubrum extorquens (strain ATCC 14718 / DSM 1338 / JCM 2805 / NCIMB 9133 / AM1) TaxID=272630 RepID=C5B694_METEA|nr:SDR family NAD(P)-dependent oxidoreductase [Methylorubrum extorquens]ACS43976.1 Hypothetical protein MexAM1_META2p1224 [Methylorubrum extorquens AM1]